MWAQSVVLPVLAGVQEGQDGEWEKGKEQGRVEVCNDLVWFVFPYTALVSATNMIATRFSCVALEVIRVVIAVALVTIWCFVFGMTVRAVVKEVGLIGLG